MTLEQGELMESLLAQSTENPEQLDLEATLRVMEQAEEVVVLV